MSAPNSIAIDLSDNDVRNDIQTVLDDMTRIRTEAAARPVDAVIKDEYMHLTFRLASNIEATASDKDVERMRGLVSGIDKPFLYYDPTFDGYWDKKNMKVAKGLERMLISLRGDRFCGLDEKYHVFQALKFLGSKGENDKQEVYDSILPNSSKDVKFEQSGLLKTLAVFLGKNYDIEIKGDTVTLNGAHRSIDKKLLSMAENLGFGRVVATVWQEYGEIDGYGIISRKEVKPLLKSDQVMSKVVKYAAPISYPLLGFLPKSIRRSLGERWNFNYRHAYAASAWTEFVAGLTMMIGGAATHNPSVWIPGIPVCAEAIVRGIIWTDDNNWPGSLPVTLVTLPFWKNLTRENKYLECTYKLDPKKYTITPDKTIGVFEHGASLQLSEDAKKSLIYTPQDNHFTFGKAFEKYGKDNFKGWERFDMDRKNSRTYAWVKYLIDGYHKAHFLIYSPDKTYLVTRISKENIEPKFIEQFDMNDARIMEKIGKNSEYTRFRTYDSGKLVGDLEATQ